MKNKWKIHILGKQISVIYLVIPAIIVGWLVMRQQFYQDKWDTLISNEYNYRIEYPADWNGTVIKSPRGADYLRGRINDNDLLPRSYVSIYSQLINDPTFQDGTIWGEKIIEKDCGYVCWEELQTERVGAEDYLALTTTYQETVAFGQVIYSNAFIIITDNGMYMLLFRTYNPSQEIEEIFDHMVESFEILEGEG